MERIDEAEADELLKLFGHRIAEFYDDAVKSISFMNEKTARDWQRLLDSHPDASDRQNKTIQWALEHLLHDLLFHLQEEREFRIQARTKSGEWFDLHKYSDGIHGDLFDWIEEKSKYGCVTTELLEVESSSEGNGHVKPPRR